jgi:hypothetical protein
VARTAVVILYIIVDNCRRLGIDTRDYLEDVLIRLPGMKASEALRLTPANWLRALQKASRENSPTRPTRQWALEGATHRACAARSACELKR